MSAIYKTFFGKHIDLDKLIFISDVCVSGERLWFSMSFQLQDNPLVYDEKIDTSDVQINYWKVLDERSDDARKRLQRQVEQIINSWEEYKKLKSAITAEQK